MVQVIAKSRTTTWMKNNQLELISELYLRQSGMMKVPRQYKTNVYYRVVNRDLILEVMPYHPFRRSAMSRIPMKGA